MLFRKSFEDVVLLRQVHRVEYDLSGASEAAKVKYREDADKFLDVLSKMADCTWTPEDHAFLQTRNKSVLRRTPEGRKEIEAFAETPLLVDGRKKRKSGEDGAQELNREMLDRISAKLKVPIAAIRAYHRYAGEVGCQGRKDGR